MSIIPFYGGKHPDLFAIERAAMDRAGKVISHLMAALPDGIVVELATVVPLFGESADERRAATEDLMWALVNTPEFMLSD